MSRGLTCRCTAWKKSVTKCVYRKLQNVGRISERFDLPLLVLQKADALERVTFELVEDLAKAGVEYAEIRFASAAFRTGGAYPG